MCVHIHMSAGFYMAIALPCALFILTPMFAK